MILCGFVNIERQNVFISHVFPLMKRPQRQTNQKKVRRKIDLEMWEMTAELLNLQFYQEFCRTTSQQASLYAQEQFE